LIHSLIDPSFQLLSSPTHVNLTHSKVIIGDFYYSGAWSVHDSAAWCSGASLLLRSVSTVFILFGAWRGLALGRFGACTLVLCLRSLVLDLSPVLSTLAFNPGAQSPKALNAFRISPATSVAVARSRSRPLWFLAVSVLGCVGPRPLMSFISILACLLLHSFALCLYDRLCASVRACSFALSDFRRTCSFPSPAATLDCMATSSFQFWAASTLGLSSVLLFISIRSLVSFHSVSFILSRSLMHSFNHSFIHSLTD